MDTAPSIRLIDTDGIPLFTDGPRLPDGVERALTDNDTRRADLERRSG